MLREQPEDLYGTTVGAASSSGMASALEQSSPTSVSL
jgi:hypothetical protein